jgi:uncharacterized protein (DUF362 family)
MQWYVDSRNGRDANDGRSLKTAFKTVQQASQVAKAGDTVLIVPGAYDQDMPKQLESLRAANVAVAVAGADH